MAQTFKIRKLDGLFLLRRERSHECADAFGEALFVESLFVLRSNNDARQFVGLILAAALAFALQTKVIKGAVARHGTQPGNKRAARRVVLTGVAPELKEDILDNFFRGGSLLENAQDQAVDEARVAVVKLFKGAHVFVKKARRQRRIKRHFAGTAACESRQEHECRLLPLLKDYTAETAVRMTVVVSRSLRAKR